MKESDYGTRPTNTEREHRFFRGGEFESALDMNTALGLLTDTLRQEILRFLVTAPDDSVSVETLYNHLDNETQLPRDVVEIRCHHIHLPKLDETGVIEYDPRMGDVRYRRDARVEHLLDEITALSR